VRLAALALTASITAWALAAPTGATPAGADPIGTIREVYDGALTSDIEVNTFRHIDRLFPVRRVAHAATASALPKHSRQLGNFRFTSAGKTYDLIDFMALDRVTGLLVLKDGEIAYEDYEFGNDPQTHWMSMSMVKSITASLMGAAIQDGYIKSIDDPVTRYLPVLAGSAYEGVTLCNLLEMASGVRWDETYVNPASDRRRMLEAQIAQQPGAILALMAKLPRAAAPGTRWNYSTGETYVAGAVVRAAVGKPLAQYLSERIWSPAGMESDATWWLDSPDGLEIGGSGLSATLRDYGRFGLFLMNDGVAGGRRILPEGWVHEAGSGKLIGGKHVNYGYMLWPIDAPDGTPNAGAFEAIGIFGQYIYVNPAARMVIVMWGAQPKPTGQEVIANEDFFAAVTQALR
jgi:CubicO group peptidase (beta-lactamase class C family)